MTKESKADKEPTTPKKTGRPSKYDPEIAREMCEMLSEGIPLREICRSDPKFPAWRTVYDWMKKDADLSTAIAHARDMGYDAMAEECLDIADNANNDWMERLDEDGKQVGWMVNGENIQRSKLRIETRLKLLAKFNPKKYGDRQVLAGDDEAPLVLEHNFSVFGELLEHMKMQRQTEG